MDDHQIPWTLIIVCGLVLLWIIRSIYQRYFGAHDPNIMRFPVSDHVIEIEGHPDEVRKAHYQVFHGAIDHRNQAVVKDWTQPIWWTGFIASRPRRLEVHVIRADQFNDAVLLLHQAKRNGVKVDARIRPMTKREARNTRNAESAREHDLHEQRRIPHPRDGAVLGFFGPKRDKIVPLKPTNKRAQRRK